MAIRYSGDVEVRLRYEPTRRAYVGTVRDPNFRWKGVYPGPAPKSSRDFDRAAEEMIRAADRDSRREEGRQLAVEEQGRGIVVRRVFQAPCPTRTAPKQGRRRNGRKW